MHLLPVQKTFEAVLLDIVLGCDASGQKTIDLRYNDGAQTYTQSFMAASVVYGNTRDLIAHEEKAAEKTIIKFLEFAPNGALDPLPRRLELTDRDLAKTVLHDDHNLLSPFKRNFYLQSDAAFLLEEKSARRAEKLKLTAA